GGFQQVTEQLPAAIALHSHLLGR
ncbi:MAG: hypothetical protein K0S88_3075, partial [Actinomycetia bacterium]|nr:hypothetical protein [Actinomycetes bacterium]